MSKAYRILLIACLWLSVTPALGAVRGVDLSLDMKLKAPRWMYDAKDKPPATGVAASLYRLRKSELDGKFTACVSLSRQLRASAQSLRPWLAVSELRCARKGAALSKDLGPVAEALQTLDANPVWLLKGPQVESLRQEAVAARLDWLEVAVRTQRRQAWPIVDALMDMRPFMNKDDLARLYRQAGELAFVQQNLELADDLISRSLDQKDSPELRDRLRAIRSKLLGQKSAPPPATRPAPPDPSLAFGEKEAKIVARMKSSLDGGDWVSAVEDGVEILRAFPGSRNATWAADRILEVYVRVAEKPEEKFVLVRERLIRQMLKVDGGRLAEWAKGVAGRSFYSDAVTLAKQALEKLDGHPESTSVLRLLGRSALFAGDHATAEKYFQELVEKHAGSAGAEEGLLRLGLIRYRAKDFVQAASFFERLLAMTRASEYELPARYWLWRSLQASEPSRAPAVAQALVDRFPVTYYGLRARAELNGASLKFDAKAPLTVKGEWWLTGGENLVWERFTLLLAAGWFEEAQAELATLPAPRSPQDQLLRAKLWALAFDHYRAVDHVTKAWDERPDLFHPALFGLMFPDEFSDTIRSEAEKHQLDSALVRALIKQESSYRPRAVSSAGARGLMQLVMPTATEAAQDLRWKKALTADDLFEPDTNIKLGTFYLRKMIRSFEGHLPLALAAYNLGIGRLKRWIGARPDLANLRATTNSAPENEIWIDELPWAETSFYVKAVLRNFIMYRYLEKGELTLQDPVWK